MNTIKPLFILDLDHTLIYGSYAESESSELLFRYNQYLTIYERPLARELIELCKKKGDIIVYTTALRRYAKMICTRLGIDPIELLSRKNCILMNQKHHKEVRQDWLDVYEQIVIIDDSPNIWIKSNQKKIFFLVPDEFRGQKDDFGLQLIIEKFKKL